MLASSSGEERSDEIPESEKITEIRYIFFGIHTANVVQLADRIEERRLAAAVTPFALPDISSNAIEGTYFIAK